MSETKWTPGEWRYIKTSRYGHDRMVDTWYVRSESDVGIAVQPNFSDDATAEANARLIAAAPSLYDALDLVMREIVGDDFEGNTDIEKKAVKDAWAALKQARGETP